MFQFKTLRNSTIDEKGNQLLSLRKGLQGKGGKFAFVKIGVFLKRHIVPVIAHLGVYDDMQVIFEQKSNA